MGRRGGLPMLICTMHLERRTTVDPACAAYRPAPVSAGSKRDDYEGSRWHETAHALDSLMSTAAFTS